MDKNAIIEILKLFSGRVLLTITASIAFLMVVYFTCKILSSLEGITFDNINSILNTLILILSNVITFYFTKESNKEE